jgi:hypothetical protein
MKPEEFEKQLQELILALAQKTAEIRAQEKK